MPKKIVFVTGIFLPKDALAKQICTTVQAAFQADTQWSIARRSQRRRADHLYVSLQPNVPGDVLLGFDLADRRHYFQTDAQGERQINKFEKIIVPGRWTHQQLTDPQRLGVDPARLMIAGAPRIDYLRARQSQHTSHTNLRPKVLFAPLHENWRDKAGQTLSIAQDFAHYAQRLEDICDVTTLSDPRNTGRKVAMTDALLAADIVITDYTSVMYEAWALGKPVIFPRWLTGDRVIEKANWIAEAHVYAKRIGHHPGNFEELRRLIAQGQTLPLGNGVETFMVDYLDNFDGTISAGQRVAQALEFLSNPDSVALEKGLIAQGQNALSNGDDATAVASFTKALTLNDFDFRPFQALAQIHRKTGDLKSEAQMMIAALERHHPETTDEWRLSEVLKSLGSDRPRTRRSAVHKAGSSDAVWKWHYDLGRMYQNEGAVDQAAASYALACAASPDPEVEKFGIGCLHLEKGYYRDAQTALTAQIADMPTDGRLLYLTGWSFDRTYAWQDAETYYRQAIALSPIQSAWHARLGFVLERQGRFEEAGTAYLFAAQNSPDDRSQNAYRAGYTFEKAGNFNLAVEAYEMCLPRTDDGSTQLDDRIAQYRRAIVHTRSADDDPDVGGISHHLSHNMDLLKQDMATDCTDPEQWYTLSQIMEQSSAYDSAADAMQQALWRSKTHKPEWYDRYGRLLATLDRYAEACAVFRQRHQIQRPYGTDEDGKVLNNKPLMKAVLYREFYETLPIVPRTILYESFGGEGISDNPLALYQYIRNDPRFTGWRHIWVIDDPKKISAEMRNDPDIFFVAKETELYQRFLCTAEYLINNATFPYYFVRKEGQHYLNTWHGTPLKTLGYDITTTPLQRANTARNLIQASMFIAPNAHTEHVMLDRYGVRPLFTGQSLLTGYPRIDATLNATPDEKRQLMVDLGLDPDKPVVLFAPTYRGHWSTPELEADEMAATLDRMQSTQYNLIFRGHYFAEKTILQMNLPVMIAPHAIDTCKLLAIVDVLVSDYSSIFYDFLVTQRPVIHYVYDWDRYVETRGVYFEKEALPGVVCETEDALLDAVAQAIKDPQGQITPHYENARETYCALEDGQASARVVEALFFGTPASETPATDRQSKRMLMYAGDLDDTQITQAAGSLLKAAKAHGWTNVLMADRRMLINDQARTTRAQNLLDRSDVLIRFGRACFSFEEIWLRQLQKIDGTLPSPEMEQLHQDGLKHEARRLWGQTAFDLVLDLSGERIFWSQILGQARAARHAMFVHDIQPGRLETDQAFKTFYGPTQSVVQTLAAQSDAQTVTCSVLDYIIDYDALTQASDARFETSDIKAFHKDRHFKFVCPEKTWSEEAQVAVLTAFQELVHNKINVSLYIQCDALTRISLEPRVKQMKLENEVTVRTWDEQSIIHYMENADGVLVASPERNGYHAAAQALFMKTPCLIIGDAPHQAWQVSSGAHHCSLQAQAIASALKDMMSRTDQPMVFDQDQYEEYAIAALACPQHQP